MPAVTAHREIEFQTLAEEAITLFLLLHMFTADTGFNRRSRRDVLHYLLKAYTGSGKSGILARVTNSPTVSEKVFFVITPSKGGGAGQLSDSFQDNVEGEGRVVHLTKENISSASVFPGRIFVMGAESIVGKSKKTGKNVKILSQVGVDKESVFTLAARCSDMGLEVIIIKDEAHIEGESYLQWVKELSEYLRYVPISISATATPKDDTSKYTDSYAVPKSEPIKEGLVREFVRKNWGLDELEEGLSTEVFERALFRGAYRQLSALRKVVLQHARRGRCNGAGSGCKMSQPAMMWQLEKAKDVDRVLGIIESVSGGALSESNGTVLVCTDAHWTKDADGNRIDPKSMNDPDSKIEIVIHHQALNEAFDSPRIQVFLTTFSSNSEQFAIQGFGRCVRTNGGCKHSGDDALNTIYIYTNARDDHKGYLNFKEAVEISSEKSGHRLDVSDAFRSDLKDHGTPVCYVFRDGRSKIILPKDETVAEEYVDTLFALAGRNTPTTKYAENGIRGISFSIFHAEMEDIGGEGSAESRETEHTRATQKDIKKAIWNWLESNVVSGRGLGAENRAVEVFLYKDYISAVADVVEGDPTIREAAESVMLHPDMDTDEFILHVALSSVEYWRDTLCEAMDQYVPHPGREVAGVKFSTLDSKRFADASAVISKFNSETMIPHPDSATLPWALKIDGSPFRSSETKYPATEVAMEEFFREVDGIRWVHKNVANEISNSVSIAYGIPGTMTGWTSYPDYLISIDRPGEPLLALIEVKDAKMHDDEQIVCMSEAYARYSKIFGIPACIAFTDRYGVCRALVGDGKSEPLAQYLDRPWKRNDVELTEDLIWEIAFGK